MTCKSSTKQPRSYIQTLVRKNFINGIYFPYAGIPKTLQHNMNDPSNVLFVTVLDTHFKQIQSCFLFSNFHGLNFF